MFTKFTFRTMGLIITRTARAAAIAEKNMISIKTLRLLRSGASTSEGLTDTAM
jgi:hypothetical protein